MQHFFHTRLLSLIFLLALGLFSQPAIAMQMEPLSLVLKPSGGGSNQTVRITNNSGKPIAVQFNITTRQQKGNKEIRRPADNQFNIYPPQMIIPAHGTQKVRVKYLGNAKIAHEQAFRLIAEQVHVSLEKENRSGLNMLMTVVGSLYVQPPRASSHLVVQHVQQRGNKLVVTVNNTGTRHELLKTAVLTLSNGSKTLILNNAHLKGLVGNNILAKTTRTFTIPIPAGFVNGNWKGSLKRT